MKSCFLSNLLCKNANAVKTLFIILSISSILVFQNLDLQGSDQPSNAKTSINILENISYKTGDNLDEYEKERCKLDLYFPIGKNDFPVIVWFHGGSLKFGSKDEEYTKAVAKRFAQEGVGMAVVNYRLFPKVKYPAYIADAAASVAWIANNISNYGGDPKSVFIVGHSAGGYLVYMLVMNPEYLNKYNVNSLDIAGAIPISAQTFTHFTIREEKGIPNPEITPIIDSGSPCYHARKETPPILVVWADGDSLDLIEQNKYLLALLEKIGHNNHSFKEIKDRTHMTLITKIPELNDPLTEEILSFINK